MARILPVSAGIYQVVGIFALLLLAASTPVWIDSEGNGGLMISWDKSHAGQIQLVIETRNGEKSHVLDRTAGMVIIARPEPPFRVGYRLANGPVVALSSEGTLPKPSSTATPTPTVPKRASVRLPFQSGPEKAALVAPVPPAHLKPVLRRAPKQVDLFIKVNPEGKVTGTSSPYYPDPVRRELARLASDIAVKQWRFRRLAVDKYRDGRVQLSFDSSGARIQPFMN